MNSRTFQGKIRFVSKVWETITTRMRETIRVGIWENLDWEANEEEAHILWKCGLLKPMQPDIARKRPTRTMNSTGKWDPPPEGIFKLKFDGVSKGNPSFVGYGYIVQHSRGNMRRFVFGFDCMGNQQCGRDRRPPARY